MTKISSNRTGKKCHVTVVISSKNYKNILVEKKNINFIIKNSENDEQEDSNRITLRPCYWGDCSALFPRNNPKYKIAVSISESHTGKPQNIAVRKKKLSHKYSC